MTEGINVDELTPMMRQYFEVKKNYPDTLVFYRLGDFYELFFDDARTVSNLLDITLTRRGNQGGAPVPMAGVPYHAADNYIGRLIKMGRSVVICEQVGDRTKGAMITRKVTRIITPGTVTDEGMVPDNQDNVLCCVFEEKDRFALARLNISTGQFLVTELDSMAELGILLSKLNPAELLYPERFRYFQDIQNVTCRKALPLWDFNYDGALKQLCTQFKTRSLSGFGIASMKLGIRAAGALLNYVKSTQNVDIEHVTSIGNDSLSGMVIIDRTAQKNLELVDNLNGNDKASVLGVLDETRTPMGTRLLRSMLVNPLRNNDQINSRLDLVEALQHAPRSVELTELLSSMGDLERIVARIGLRSAKPRDLSKLRDAIELLPQFRSLLLEGTGITPEQLDAGIKPEVGDDEAAAGAAGAAGAGGAASSDKGSKSAKAARATRSKKKASHGKTAVCAADGVGSDCESFDEPLFKVTGAEGPGPADVAAQLQEAAETAADAADIAAVTELNDDVPVNEWNEADDAAAGAAAGAAVGGNADDSAQADCDAGDAGAGDDWDDELDGADSHRPEELVAAGEITGRMKLLLAEKAGMLPELGDMGTLLRRAVAEFPALMIRDGGVIADGFNQELDELRDLQNGSENVLLAIEEREKARTGINTLKVRFNNVHGYYIEVSRLSADKVPAEYVRRQTLKNSERYITPELKVLEEKTLSARTRCLQLEKELYDRLIEELILALPRLSAFAHNIAMLDVSLSLARVALKRHYVRPQLSTDSHIRIVEGRHPVVETISDSQFIVNSLELNSQKSLAVISGPNMGGKSTFMRQTALIAIMARIGSFVPATEAVIGDIDRIFTRIGASDDLASGRSTFMVEMEETATIVNNATAHSLVIMDEVGRGTSGAEGAAIAEAIVQFLSRKVRPLTMFATHYTEVTALVENYANAFNLCFNAREFNGRMVFFYTAQPGRQSRSYGIEVARLAGVPPAITKSAIGFYNARTKELESADIFTAPLLNLSEDTLESGAQGSDSGQSSGDAQSAQLTEALRNANAHIASLEARVFESEAAKATLEHELKASHELRNVIATIDLNSLTPLEALNTLSRLKESLRTREE